jgi:hypothetical protein
MIGFTGTSITVNYNSSQSVTFYDSLHSSFSSTVTNDERRIVESVIGSPFNPFNCNCLERQLSDESLHLYEWTLFYNFGRTEQKPPSLTLNCHSPIFTGILVKYSWIYERVLASSCLAMGFSLGLRYSCFQAVFIEPLPSNGHICHNISVAVSVIKWTRDT